MNPFSCFFRPMTSAIAALCVWASLAPAQTSAPTALQPLPGVVAALSGQTVLVAGRLSSILPPSIPGAPQQWYVTDNQGVVVVSVPETLLKWEGQPAAPYVPEAAIQARGKVVLNRGALVIAPESAADIALLPEGFPMGFATGPTLVLLGASNGPASASAAQAAPLPEGVLTPGQVDASKSGQTVLVRGTVDKYRAKWNDRSPSILYLSGGGGAVELVYWDEVAAALEPRLTELTQTGSVVQAEGEANEFNGRVQIKIQTADKLTLIAVPSAAAAPAAAAAAAAGPAALPAAVAALTPAQVTSAHVGKTVTLTGAVKDVRPSRNERAPNTITLEGGGATLDVVFWKQVADALGSRGAALAAPGTQIRALGEVSEFQGKLQVRVQNAADLQVVGQETLPPASQPAAPSAPAAALAPAASSESTVLSPSQLSHSHLDKLVAVRGTVQTVRPSTKENIPTRVELTDGAATINVVFWLDKAPLFSGAMAPEAGKPWGVRGKVAEFQGKLQLRADSPLAP